MKVPAVSPERIPLKDGRGRVLAQDIACLVEVPRFDNSAMDGYAVRSQDLKGASPEAPVILSNCGVVPAGASGDLCVEEGQCVRIFTGSVLPGGADGVIMQENVKVEGDRVFCLDEVKPFENVRLRGEDLRKGDLLLRSGTELSSGGMSLLASQGVCDLLVSRKPVIGILATGSELVEPGTRDLEMGEIFESNRILIRNLILDAGGEAKKFPIVPDDSDATRRSLEVAFDECDAVITSGGASVGELDYVKDAFEAMGGELGFWKVSMKPGKPFIFGRHQQGLLFGLPGNPLSAMVTFLVLVRPALRKWLGVEAMELPSIQGRLGAGLSNKGNRRHFMRVCFSKEGKVVLAGMQASHGMSSMGGADGLVDIPPGASLQAGDEVRVYLIR